MSMILFGGLFITAIALVFGGHGLVSLSRLLAKVFLVCCLVGAIGIGGLMTYWFVENQRWEREHGWEYGLGTPPPGEHCRFCP